MALKSILESVDDLPDNIKAEYTEKEIAGKKVFVLDVEGIEAHPGAGALKTALERVRSEKKTLGDNLKTANDKLALIPAEFTTEEWVRLKALDENDPDDPERKKARDAALAGQKKIFENQIENLKKAHAAELATKDQTITKKDEQIGKMLVDDGLTKALVEAGVGKHFLKAATAMLRGNVKVVHEQDGSRAFFETDLGEAEIGEFVGNWAKTDEGKAFIPPAAGGGAPGSQRPGGDRNSDENPFSQRGWSKTKQGALISSDRVKAERLAKAAGFADLAAAAKAMKALEPAKTS